MFYRAAHHVGCLMNAVIAKPLFNLALTLLAVGWCVIGSQAMAFDLDGFFSGMTRDEALKKLLAAGLTPQETVAGKSERIAAGAYEISFCPNGRVAAVTKILDVHEFNAYLLSMLANHGQPSVGIPSPDLDILYLRWTLNDGSDFALNSGTDQYNGRFHNVGAVDNSYCHT